MLSWFKFVYMGGITLALGTDLVIYSKLINQSPNWTHLHRALCTGHIGLLATISQPAALWYAISLSSLHHNNALRWPFAFTDFSLSLSSFWHFRPQFVPTSLPPSVVACFLSSHAFEISDEWDFPSFSSFLSPSPAYLWTNQSLPLHTSGLSLSFLPRTSVQSELHSSSPEFWLYRGLVFSSPTSDGTSILNSTGP